MELTRAIARSGALGRGPTQRASLRIVGQRLTGKEGLLTGREDELLGAIAARKVSVLVHVLQTLLGSGPTTIEDRDTEMQRVGGEHDVTGRALGRPGLGPGTL